jgi:hypothetical protein
MSIHFLLIPLPRLRIPLRRRSRNRFLILRFRFRIRLRLSDLRLRRLAHVSRIAVANVHEIALGVAAAGFGQEGAAGFADAGEFFDAGADV